MDNWTAKACLNKRVCRMANQILQKSVAVKRGEQERTSKKLTRDSEEAHQSVVSPKKRKLVVEQAHNVQTIANMTDKRVSKGGSQVGKK